MKFKLKDIVDSMQMIDMGCCWFGIDHPKYKKTICFDDDEKGNGKAPYLYLRFYKDYARFTGGLSLTSEEKKLKFPYSEYKDVDSYVDNLARYTQKYFKSFKLVRV